MRMRGKKMALICYGLATVIVLACSASGCAKDVTPPVIQQYQIPEQSIEDEDVNVSIRTADEIGVTEVYVQLDSGEKINLTKLGSKKNGEEVSTWQASFKLSPKDYSYSILAVDKAGNKSDPKEGEITVYPTNSIFGYARDKSIDTYIPQLLSLEQDGAFDQYDKAFVNLVAKYPKAGELVPRIYGDILKLPDLSMEKYSKIDEKDLPAVEKILELASDPNYTSSFLSIDSVGIEDSKKYNAALEALFWLARDNKNISDLLDNFSLEGLINDAWKHTSTSRDYKSDRWENFDEVVARLNSPYLAYWYLKDNITFVPAYGPGSWKTAKELFDKKIGVCKDDAVFITYCLLHNGYNEDDFDNRQTNAACTLIMMRLKGKPNKDDFTTALKPGDKNYNLLAGGHAVALVKIDGKIYCFDPVPLPNPHVTLGPYNDIDDVINATKEAFNCGTGYTGVYTIGGDHPWDDTKDELSKPLSQWIWMN